MEKFVSINGNISELNQAKIPILDRGFLYGEAIAETLVVFDEHIISLEQHLERLEKSAKQNDISIDWDRDKIKFELKSMLSLVKAKKKYIRIIITSGEGFGLEHSISSLNNRYIFIMPAPIQNEKIYHEGISLGVFKQGFTNRAAMAKTTQYSSRTRAFRQTKKNGFDDCLHVNLDGEIGESTSANVFFVERQGEEFILSTPALKSGILEGITRAKIINICHDFNIKIIEKIIPLDSLAKFDEAFLSSSVKGLIPIYKTDQHRLHTTRKDSFFKKIELIFITYAEKEIGRKIDWNLG